MRVLFVSHTSDFSGAENALLRLLESLPGSVETAVACPPAGPLADALDRAGIARAPIPGTALSFRLSPVATARGLRDLARSVLAVRRAAERWRADVIHANGVRAGLLSLASRAPVVVQVHDNLPYTLLGRVVRHVLARADAVLAVSRTTAASFDRGLRRGVARPLYISMDHDRFRPDRYERAATRRALGIPPDAPVLGEVAQITPWKGQMLAIEALARTRERHPDARLLLIGEVTFTGAGVRYDNEAYERSLHERVDELGLRDAVHFLGRRDDVPALVDALDLLLLPSWEEPFGTAALEGMAMGTVPLVSADGGVAEYVEDGRSGRVLPPHEPEAWARAATELLDAPDMRARMGAEARAVAERFTDEAYVEGCLKAYSDVSAVRRSRSGWRSRR